LAVLTFSKISQAPAPHHPPSFPGSFSIPFFYHFPLGGFFFFTFFSLFYPSILFSDLFFPFFSLRAPPGGLHILPPNLSFLQKNSPLCETVMAFVLFHSFFFFFPPDLPPVFCVVNLLCTPKTKTNRAGCCRTFPSTFWFFS